MKSSANVHPSLTSIWMTSSALASDSHSWICSHSNYLLMNENKLTWSIFAKKNHMSKTWARIWQLGTIFIKWHTNWKLEPGKPVLLILQTYAQTLESLKDDSSRFELYASWGFSLVFWTKFRIWGSNSQCCLHCRTFRYIKVFDITTSESN